MRVIQVCGRTAQSYEVFYIVFYIVSPVAPRNPAVCWAIYLV